MAEAKIEESKSEFKVVDGDDDEVLMDTLAHLEDLLLDRSISKHALPLSVPESLTKCLFLDPSEK